MEYLKNIEPAHYSLVAYIIGITLALWIAIRRRRERDAYKKQLDDLRKKSQEEQDLSLATLEQIMTEVAQRMPGFIMLHPNATNDPKEVSMCIHIKGIDPQGAIMAMQQACYVIANNPPGVRIEPDEV